jgi:hypothetical protein
MNGTHLDFSEPGKAYNNEIADVKKPPDRVALAIKKMNKRVARRQSHLGDEGREMWREVRMSDERAWFLEEESEERIEQDFLAGEIAA